MASSAIVLPPGIYLASAADGTTSGIAVDLSSAFDGQAAGGTWQLFIRDVANGDLGSFASWTLTADVEATAPGGVREPGTMALLAGGLGLLALIRRRG